LKNGSCAPNNNIDNSNNNNREENKKKNTQPKLATIYLTGTSGYWLCLTTWGLQMSSLINLAAIAVERYLKIVHAIWSKNKLRKWMVNSIAAFSWIAAVAVSVELR